jgi:hypothetical protein
VCSSSSSSYEITDVNVNGTATACGMIQNVTSPTLSPGTSTTPPSVNTLPQFIFDANNYLKPDGTSALSCYPSSGTCGATNTSPTAYSDFNTYFTAHQTAMSGDFAVWQTNPSQSTVVSLDGIRLNGDLTIITNAPIYLGNTNTVTTTAASSNLVIVSLYVPPTGSNCDTNGGDCSIYWQNSIVFDAGSPTDPNDGVAALVYTPGKMAVKNSGSSQNTGEGALYAGSMDIKNGFGIAYNSRVETVLGFGLTLEQVLWKEINV